MKTRILYVIDLLEGTLGGTEQQLKMLINGLNTQEFEPFLVCLRDTPWMNRNARSLRCESRIIEIRGWRSPHAYANMARLILHMRNVQPDVVHTYFPFGNVVGIIAARIAGVPGVFSSRRDYGEWMNRRYLQATQYANRHAQKIVVNSRAVGELTETVEKVARDKIEVIYNGIDLECYRNLKPDPSLRRKLNIPTADKIVGLVANFRPMKNHATFILAASEILKADSNVSFILVGSGSTMDESRASCDSLRIADKVHFVGKVEDVIPYVGMMDVGINCSSMEGLSNAVMEYMAAGVPCVVTKAGGNTDLVTDGYNGFAFEAHDFRSLAALTLELLKNRNKAEVFAERSRAVVGKCMKHSTMLHKYEELYRSARRH